ncbi:hypothetical protein F4779DRAFT_634728 [Xylariaceae sp. FL0662B]|nr:hypothetical protein F4779DRAFT_634728 [Xylariaceae sp. FL0662B]
MDDAIEKFFNELPSPESDRDQPHNDQRIAYTNAIQSFCNTYRANHKSCSRDPDLHVIARISFKALRCPCPMLSFKNKIAQFALNSEEDWKDQDSAKAKQLRYIRWVAQGRPNYFKFPFGLALPGSILKPLSSLSGLPQIFPSNTSLAYIDRRYYETKACSNCSKRLRGSYCASCAALVDGHIIGKTGYCDNNCKEADWGRHRHICQYRRLISRAVSLLHALFELLIESTCLPKTKRVKERNGIISVYQDYEKSLYCGDFVGQAGEVWSSARRLVGFILDPVCSSYDQVCFYVKNVCRPTCVVDQGTRMSNMFKHHSVIRATVYSGEQFAIDLTGAQFGWRETLAPWEAYKTHRQTGEEVQAPDPALTALDSTHISQDERAQRLIRTSVTEIILEIIRSTLEKHDIPLIGMLQLPIGEFIEIKYEIISNASIMIPSFLSELNDGIHWRLFYDHNFNPHVTGYGDEALERIWFTDEEYWCFKESHSQRWLGRARRERIQSAKYTRLKYTKAEKTSGMRD